MDKEDHINLRQVPVEEILVAQREETESKEKIEQVKSKALHERGFCVDSFTAQNDLY